MNLVQAKEFPDEINYFLTTYTKRSVQQHVYYTMIRPTCHWNMLQKTFLLFTHKTKRTKSKVKPFSTTYSFREEPKKCVSCIGYSFILHASPFQLIKTPGEKCSNASWRNNADEKLLSRNLFVSIFCWTVLNGNIFPASV